MADRRHRVFGTEDDKDNCSFFYKTGACRHGERCSRKHIRPNFSVTISIAHMYYPSPPEYGIPEQQCFEEFFEDVLGEVKKYGYVEDMIVIENLGEHMNGNVYIKYSDEKEAETALRSLDGRQYAGVLLKPQYCPVTDFRESRCRQHDTNTCTRDGFCNFMHIRPLPRWLKRELDKCNLVYAKENPQEARVFEHNDYSNRGRGRELSPERETFSSEFQAKRDNSAERRKLLAAMQGGDDDDE